MRNVALDLAARKVAFCEVRGGKVIGRRTVSALTDLFDELGPGNPPARVAIEACRESWHVCKVLESWGHSPVLVDTTRVKRLGIGAHGRKTDRIDAEVLARSVESGGIPVAHRLSESSQQLRMLIGVRAHLVEMRAGVVVVIRGIARARGVPIPSCAIQDFTVTLEKVVLDHPTRKLIEPLMASLRAVDIQARAVDESLRTVCATNEDAVGLATCTGVGAVVAASFISVIDDPHRFRNAHQVEAYVGLVPSEDSSGDRRRIGSITKQGNPYLRRVLVQAAWCVLRSKGNDDPLVCWAKQVAKRRGKRIAVIAAARRLTGILWAMWKRKTVYDPAQLASSSTRGLEARANDAQADAASMRLAATKKLRNRKPVSNKEDSARV